MKELWRRLSLAFLFLGSVTSDAQDAAHAFELTVTPPEHKKMSDPETGAELLFLTADPAKDTNLYFHERSWLADGSLILFNSAREDGGIMAYVAETGELVHFSGDHAGIRAVNAAKDRNTVFGLRGNSILEWSLTVEVSSDPQASQSRVTATERVVATLSGASPHTPPNESSDGRHLAVGVNLGAERGIFVIDLASGEYRELCRVPEADYGGHVQWSHNNPNMLSYAGRTNRLMVVDIREGVPRSIYQEWEGENVTHEHWWVADAHGDDQIVFCGGTHPEPVEDAHVKIINVNTGVVRVLGAGAWWPDGTDEEVAKQNFWHCAGSEDGRWVVADNWHGDITLFEGKTSRPRILTAGHRNYGHGDHPHVGWDRDGRQVIFTSHILGTQNVCIATIPEEWQKANP